MTRSYLDFLPSLFLSVAATNFTQCLTDFQNGTAVGGVDYDGQLVSNPRDAVGLTYDACRVSCGTGHEKFDWSVFAQQFSAWLLPWLALVSQLPFGAEIRLDNLISGEPQPALVYFIGVLNPMRQSPSLSGPPPSQHSRSPSRPSILAGPTTVSLPSITPIAGMLSTPSSIFSRFHCVSPPATDS